MKRIACLSACFLAGVVLSASAQQPDSGCQFSIVHAPAVPSIAGPDEVVSRARVMKQPDSPVAIVSADFTGSTLIAGSGSYWFDDAFSIDVVNISDRPLRGVRVWIQVVMVLTDGRRGGGAGTGVRWQSALAPGATARLRFRGGGPGQGTHPEGERVEVVALVESAEMDGCVFKPALSWPKASLDRPVRRDRAGAVQQ